MNRQRMTPSFKGLRAASKAASAAARGASAKANTRCELLLRRALSLRRLRYRLHHPGLPGRPDIVFPKHRLLVFCDGDFWHGHDLEMCFKKLARGHNAPYWIAKVQRNVERDRRQTRALRAAGWVVLRFWETDILRRPGEIVDRIVAVLNRRDAIGNYTAHTPAQRSPVGTSLKLLDDSVLNKV
jgi:DNA mismatch endonuclease (patch repair protein)